MLWSLLLLQLLSPAVAQDSVYGPVVKKHRDKVRSRWTLEDWMSLKRRRRQQDEWLAWNTKKGPFFELVIDVHGGGHDWKRDGTEPDDESFVVAGGGFQAYLGPVGIGVGRDQYKVKEKAQYSQRDEGAVYLRILGNSSQNTHLTLLGGIHKYEHKYYGDFDQYFYGGLVNLYLFRHLGLEGQIRLKASAESVTHKLTGEDYHWGVFWELSILRLYLVYHQDLTRAKRLTDGAKDNERVNGPVMGARLYF